MREPVDVLVDAAIDAVRDSGVAEANARMATVSVVNSDGTVDVEVPGGSFPGVRLLGMIYSPNVGDLVEILRTSGGWVCLGRLRNGWQPTIQSGRVTTPSSGSSPWAWTTATVTFDKPFASTPQVVATPSSAVTSTSTETFWSVSGESPTGFTMRCRRTSNNATTFNWIATTH